MAVSCFPEGILVKWGCIIKCDFIGGKSIKSLVDIEREGFLDTRRVVALYVYVKWNVVFLSERAMLTLKEVKGHV